MQQFREWSPEQKRLPTTTTPPAPSTTTGPPEPSQHSFGARTAVVEISAAIARKRELVSHARTASIGPEPSPGAAAAHPERVDQARERHRPEETLLCNTLQAHWRTFLAELNSSDHCGGDSSALPAFVVAEVEAFLRCGILAHGFVLARCPKCGWSRAVAFSCQRRGFCPSCIGRRMCDFAATLADRVIPRVPVRQWVLTVPHGLRARLAHDPGLTSEVLRQLIAAVSAWLRARARRLGIRVLKTGAVTLIQRFN